MILPIGISFYTFMTISYVIDVYRGEIEPTRSLVDFALFVAYFPHLVAGPILRASLLLPQIERPRRISGRQIVEGLWLTGWGTCVNGNWLPPSTSGGSTSSCPTAAGPDLDVRQRQLAAAT